MSTGKKYVVCVRVVLEGVESHSSIDPGGHTIFGFSKSTRVHLGLPDNMTTEQADAAYIRHFWMPRGCDAMPPIIGWLVCDAFVNHSTRSAAIIIQRALGNVKVDGAYGPATMQACKDYPNAKIFMQRYAFHRRGHFARRSGYLITKYTREIDAAKTDEERAQAENNHALAITQEHGWQNRLDKLFGGMWDAGIVKSTPSKTARVVKTAAASVTAGAAVAVGTGAGSSVLTEAASKAIELALDGNLTTVGVATWVAGAAYNSLISGGRWAPKWLRRWF